MTQIVGIVCRESVNYSPRDTIIIACESQFTIGHNKLTNAQKMAVIRFQNNQEALIALAGSVTHSLRAIRYMAEIAKGKALDNETTVASVAEEAIERVRSDILRQMQKRAYSLEEQARFFCSETNYFELMIAHFFGEGLGAKPYLYTIAIEPGIATPAFPYAAIGIGSDLAHFILKRFPLQKARWEVAVPLAIHVIEEIKGSDVYCDGAVKVGIVERHGCQFYGENLVEGFSEELKKIQKKFDTKYEEELVATINKVSRKVSDRFEKWRKKSELPKGKILMV